jgi:heptaprenylglyceryl phosphate synthase
MSDPKDELVELEEAALEDVAAGGAQTTIIGGFKNVSGLDSETEVAEAEKDTDGSVWIRTSSLYSS